jgi:hypothetical protein
MYLVKLKDKGNAEIMNFDKQGYKKDQFLETMVNTGIEEEIIIVLETEDYSYNNKTSSDRNYNYRPQRRDSYETEEGNELRNTRSEDIQTEPRDYNELRNTRSEDIQTEPRDYNNYTTDSIREINSGRCRDIKRVIIN